MATKANIEGFHKGEYIEIVLLAKDRDGSVITTPASQLVSFTVGDTPAGTPSLTFTTVTGEVVLTDAPTGEFTVQLEASDLSTLLENRTYYYNLWSELSPSQPLLQAKGKFKLLNSHK